MICCLLPPNLTWHTPPECQGQMVEVSYADTCDGAAYRRTRDRSDGVTTYAVAYFSKMPRKVAAMFEPWNEEPKGVRWTPCEVKEADDDAY